MSKRGIKKEYDDVEEEEGVARMAERVTGVLLILVQIGLRVLQCPTVLRRGRPPGASRRGLELGC